MPSVPSTSDPSNSNQIQQQDENVPPPANATDSTDSAASSASSASTKETPPPDSTPSTASIEDTHQDIISEETLKKLYADQASKRANHNATTSSASLPHPKVKRPAFDAFQTKFKWARIYDSEHFPFDDVLSELTAMKKLAADIYTFTDTTFAGSDKKVTSATTIMKMDEFYKSYTPKQLQDEGLRFKTTDLLQKDYIDFIVNCSQENDIFATVDIPWAVFQQSSLATHRASIAKSIKMLAQTTLEKYASTMGNVS